MQVKLIYLMVIRLNPATGKECHISKFENSFAIASEEEGGRGQLTLKFLCFSLNNGNSLKMNTLKKMKIKKVFKVTRK